MTFKENVYSLAVMKFIKNQIEQNNIKALEILFCVNEIDKLKLF